MTLKVITNEKYNDIKNFLVKTGRNIDEQKLDDIFNKLNEEISNKLYINNEPLIDSTLGIAKIFIEEIGLGYTSLLSFFIHQLYRYNNNIDLNNLLKNYNDTVKRIVYGLNDLSRHGFQNVSSQSEILRDLLLNLAKDLRVILIVLAEHLYQMRIMKFLDRNFQLKLAYDARELYAPLAHRLGLYSIKTEMEDLYLKYTDRETYDSIARLLSEKMKQRKEFIENFIKTIDEALRKNGFTDFEIKGRPKSIYSIWNKMTKKGVEFEDIYDLFAIRIILNSKPDEEKADCWRVYSIVTDLYQPNPLRLRDWISVPKSNGYESLHTTVIGPDGRWVEIQIRTRRMDEIAEKGFAAHWKYKENKGENSLENWLIKVRELLEHPLSDNQDLIDDFKLSLYNKEIFVFTPKGELRKLPVGATVLDFAYDIHSELGEKCIGAKVNGKIVPLRYVLQNGDRVEILTSKNQKPNADWLTFVVTSKARSKIKQKINEEKTIEAEKGKEIIQRRLKNWKIEFNDEIIQNLIRHFKFPNAQEFYYAISQEKIDLSEVKNLLTEEKNVSTPEFKTSETKIDFEENKNINDFLKTGDYLIIDDQLTNVNYKLAKCCNPIHGDEIFGFVTINEGIKIHRTNCPNAAQLISKYGYRIVKAKWKEGLGMTSFPVEIKIIGEDRPGILNDINDIISKKMKLALRSINYESTDGTFTAYVRLMVLDTKHLNMLIGQLHKLKGIFNVRRRDFYNDTNM